MKIIRKSVSILLSALMVISLFTIVEFTVNAATSSINYINSNGARQTAEDVTVLTEELTTIGQASETTWYALTSDININERIRCQGDVHLVLGDGFTLTANKGIEVNSGASFTVYGEQKTSGTLIANSYIDNAAIGGNIDKDSGLITINSGKIIARASDYCLAAAIGGGGNGAGNVVINGGEVEAYNDNGGTAIGSGFLSSNTTNVTINGGKITTAADKGDSIGGSNGGDAEIRIYGGNITTGIIGSITAKSKVIIVGGTIKVGAISSNNTEGLIAISGGNITADYIGCSSSGMELLELQLIPGTGEFSVYSSYYQDKIKIISALGVTDGYNLYGPDATNEQLRGRRLYSAHTCRSVHVNGSENGTVRSSLNYPQIGENVYLDVTPDTGYELDTLSVKTTEGKNIAVNNNSFKMPEDNVYVTATFKLRTFTVKWNVDDTNIKTDESVPYGTIPVYDGETPSKASGAQYTYTFIGWTDGTNTYLPGEAFPAVTGNITYNAVFTETVNNYTVIWKNGDTVLETDTDVPYGTSPTYDGDEPTKAADENYGYVFDGWSPEVNIVTGNVTYTAQFNQALHVDMTEPYIDSNGEYILGAKEHYEMDGKCYAVNQDRSVGEEISDISISYFDFSELSDGTYQVSRYTGPMDSEYTINELVIPDTYNGKRITVLGSGSVSESFVPEAVLISTLKLSKNITEIKQNAFILNKLSKVTGDTSGLKKLGSSAFAAFAHNPDDKLDINLDYEGTIDNNGSVFGGYDVTLHIKHATKFKSTGIEKDTITYDFTDDHIYGEPLWSWSNDYISATAKFTCTDLRCKHERTVHATVKKAEAVDKITYKAEAAFEGESYSDIKEVFKPCYNVTVESVNHGTVTADKTKAYAGEEITLTGNPDEGYSIVSFSVRDAAENKIEVINNKFIMPDSDVTVSATPVYGIYHAVTEPSIDENGAYQLGNVEYFEIDGKNYAVKPDNTPGEELDSVELSYFTFQSAGGNYRIGYYTGPTENLTELRFPKTYGGKKITEIGNGEYEPLFHTTGTEPLTVYLTENITGIRLNAFEQLRIKKVTGDTSALKNIGGFAFSCPNGASDYPKLEIQLDYPGRITTNEHSFRDLDVVIRLKHATTLSKTDFVASSVEYIFTDGHVGTPIWTWAGDYSTATAEFTCTDSRCNHEETVNATVTQSDDGGKITYTATATIGGTEYTDTKVVIYNPLDELFEPSITAADALGLDNNLFNLPGTLEYTKAKLLGVQRKETIKTDTAGTGLRFVAELSSEFVGRDDIDYGFEVVKTSKNNTAEFSGANGFDIMQNLINASSGNIKSISCKDTSNNITGDTRYGDKDDTSTEYKYVTLAVNDIPDNQGVAVRFYVEIDGIRYYASYTDGSGNNYRGCCASYERLLSISAPNEA